MQREIIEALAVEPVGWREFANCLGANEDLFFPDRGASTRAAKQICAECQVRVDCLEYAVTQGEKFGIWGGLSERERRKIRKRRAMEAQKRAVS
ncbi:MAG: WhiB family transcriptional regulator [bacterium]|nr:WhiB family transcriptional regulator [bacterium]MXX64245.1 WhiB family transcriptional regulator [Acidimicrobiia bacterium]MCY3579527.1 WhiB family transcriptional regulator [bacterium]MCY3652365.1 WhiB family transcriptional regulator [bacterium]MDE0644475.1 WhiB family transcriptional regulator [bacterium]